MRLVDLTPPPSSAVVAGIFHQDSTGQTIVAMAKADNVVPLIKDSKISEYPPVRAVWW